MPLRWVAVEAAQQSAVAETGTGPGCVAAGEAFGTVEGVTFLRVRRVGAAVLAAVVVVSAAGCSGGGEGAGSPVLTCDALIAAEERASSEAEFFEEMAALAESVGATVEAPDGGAGNAASPAGNGSDGDGSDASPGSAGTGDGVAGGADVAAAFRRLAAASREFSREHPASADRTGAAAAALAPEERAAMDAALSEMIAAHDDDFQVTWAWLSDTESELGCR